MKTKIKSVPDLFKSEREEWVEECRQAARQLLSHRETVTIEDVTAVCTRPSYVHMNTAGQVFKHPDFQFAGFTKAKRTTAKGRWIMRWKLNDERALDIMQRQRKLQLQDTEQ